MPTTTSILGLKKPLGNETVTRQAYNENLDLIDQNVATKTDFATHLADGVQHKIVDTQTGAKFKWGIENGQLYLEEVD